jgi:hypothetical protein
MQTNKPTIAQLNDHLRKTFTGGQVMLTRTIASMEPEQQADILTAVRTFDSFTEANDPHGEHDCAIIETKHGAVMFKIDPYDLDLLHYSPDPTDPTVTKRVLTIMLAEEY